MVYNISHLRAKLKNHRNQRSSNIKNFTTNFYLFHFSYNEGINLTKNSESMKNSVSMNWKSKNSESMNWESVSNISLQSPIDVTLPISVLLVTSSLTDGNSVPTLPLGILSKLLEAVISSGESYYIN